MNTRCRVSISTSPCVNPCNDNSNGPAPAKPYLISWIVPCNRASPTPCILDKPMPPSLIGHKGYVA
ncbi:MAG: hypothetical protein QXE79_06515 [Candidatus Bathyarchaeia archaeon]